MLIILLNCFFVTAQEEHEYAPLQEHVINYKDWTYKNLKNAKESISFSKWATGKKLVLVVYYAPWCGNWRNEFPVLNKLYEKYKSNGFDIIAVNEYGSKEEASSFYKDTQFTFVIESENQEQREKTTHYIYRTQTGDTRMYGSPYNVFLEPSQFSSSGDVLIEKAWVVNGELIEDEIEVFIDKCLKNESSPSSNINKNLIK